jgi:uncharacterized protein YqiB (DUF1249 family)
MQRPLQPWAAPGLLAGRPDVGALMSLCEENYARLLRLAPGLATQSGSQVSSGTGGVELWLAVEDQARFTTSVRLTYHFPLHGQRIPDPDARLRAYHDARQVEVIDLVQTALPLRRGYGDPAFAEKWQANLFLAKWLAYCLRQGHRFGVLPTTEHRADPAPRVTTCP